MDAGLLLSVAWKSLVIGAGILLVLRFARDHSAAQRSRMLLTGMALLAVLPLLLMMIPALPMRAPAASTLTSQVSAALAHAPAAVPSGPQTVAPPPAIDLGAALVLLWISVAAVLLARLALGIAVLARWTAQAGEVRARTWQRASRSAQGAGVRVLVSERVAAPLSWGVRRPVILLSRAVLTDGSDAHAIIAHELAHIRRRDWVGLVFARLVVALYWFNPLVGWLARELLNESEEAADAEALRLVQPARYAETLLKVAAGPRLALPANSVAAGSLSGRILRIIEGSPARSAAAWKVAAAYLLLAFSAPVIAVQFVPGAKTMVRHAIASVPVSIGGSVATIAAAVPVAESKVSAASVAAKQVAARAHQSAAEAERSAAVAAGAARTATAVAAPRAADAAGAVAQAMASAARASDGATRAVAVAMRTVDQSMRAKDGALRATDVTARVAESVRRGHEQMVSGMDRGAQQMDAGAARMDQGAQRMRDEAARLRDPAYRQRKIAEAAARGQTLTDEQLVESISDLNDGAKDMAEGADDMRRGADEMRRSARQPE